MARENLGKCGFGDVGAVVGATYPAEMAQLRQMLPEVVFLVPGFGARALGRRHRRGLLRRWPGAIVNSSRGVLFPFAADDPAWEARVESATRATIAALAAVSQGT